MFADAGTIELSRPYVAEIREADRTVPLLSVADLDPRIEELAARCASFLDLGDNWNSYRARPIEESLIEDGLRIAAMVLAPGRRAPAIVPTATGGVQLEWHSADEDLEIEVRALGRYRVYHRKGVEENEFDVRDDLTRLVQIARALAK